jgi:hypothetical protein
MDPMRFLESEDPVEVAVMWIIADHWLKVRYEQQKVLAHEIVKALAEAVKK